MKPSAICSPEDFERRYHKPKAGRVLIVGSRVYATRTDRRARYSNVVGVDMTKGPGVDVVLDLEEPLPYTDANNYEGNALGKFAHIDCISVLEHSRRPWLLAANIERLLVPGGTLFVQAPFVWRVHSYPSDLWRYTTEGIRQLFPNIRWAALQFVHGQATETIPNMWHDKLLYFARTEVCGFGRKV